MRQYRFEAAVLGAAAAVIGVVAMSMSRFSFDVWAGVVITPVLVVAMLPIIRRLLGPDLHSLVPIVWFGFLVKILGSIARYYVVFDAYGKNGDAERYYDAGNLLAAAVRAGNASFFTVLPLARDTAFIERLTGLVFTLLGGPSRLGGFFVFSTFAYIGTVCFIRAACMAVPGLATRRYALFCALAPSLAFWPSSLGKEAWIIGCTGILSLGIAKIICWEGRSGGVFLFVSATIGVGVVRPHMAAIYVGAATMAIAYSVVAPNEAFTFRRRRSLLGFTVIAVAGLAFASTAALRYLGDGTTSSSSSTTGVLGGVTNILARTSGQTEQGGSAFTPIDIGNPARWPYAVFRTLTRPLLPEARSLATLLPALETTLFLAFLVIGWRRTINFVPTLRRSPYLMFVSFTTILFGLAFTAVGNLGILVRQRSIVVPFMLVLLCLPPRATKKDRGVRVRQRAYA